MNADVVQLGHAGVQSLDATLQERYVVSVLADEIEIVEWETLEPHPFASSESQPPSLGRPTSGSHVHDS